MTTPVVQVLHNFDALRETLRSQGIDPHASPGQDVFYTLAWFENLALNGVEPSPRLALHLTRDPESGDLLALALQADSRLQGLSTYYSSLYGPMQWARPPGAVAPADPSLAACQQLARHWHADPARWPVLTFSPLDRQSAFFGHLQTALAHAGYRVDPFFCFGNWYLPVQGCSASTYLANRPAALRHSLARGQRRLSRQGPWHTVIHRTPGPALAQAIGDFERVYAQSWKSPEPHPRFMPSLMQEAAKQGWLRLGVLSLDGQPIAAQVWLVKDGKASIYKLAYVSGFERLSAGSVLTQALMRHVIDEDRVQEVDYLTGDDAYKQDWMTHRRERWGLVAFHTGTWTGWWAAWRHRLGHWLRRWRPTRATPSAPAHPASK